MNNLSLLKQQVQWYSQKVNALTIDREKALRKDEDDFVSELYLDKQHDIKTQYINIKNKYKIDVLEVLSETIDKLKKKLEGKSTSTATSNDMRDITLLQLIGTITESQLKVYVEKYKEYPMILNYLKQIGKQNGYDLSYKNIDDANKIIENLEVKTTDFLENYDPSNVSYDHTVMLLDQDNYYDMVEKNLNEFIQDTKVKITKIQ